MKNLLLTALLVCSIGAIASDPVPTIASSSADSHIVAADTTVKPKVSPASPNQRKACLAILTAGTISFGALGAKAGRHAMLSPVNAARCFGTVVGSALGACFGHSVLSASMCALAREYNVDLVARKI